MNNLCRLSVILACLPSILIPGGALADDPALRSQPERSSSPPSVVDKRAVVSEEMSAVPIARRIELPPVSDTEITPLRNNNTQPRTMRALQVGISRTIDEARATSIARGLPWQVRSDSTKIALLEIASPGASALRAELSATAWPAGATLWFSGKEGGRERLGPVTTSSLVDGSALWSPVVSGDVIVIEIRLPAGTPAGDVDFSIRKISHLFYDPARSSWEKMTGIDASAGCQPDVVCSGNDPAMRTAAASVARMIYTRPEGSYLCTGTLLADRDLTSQIPYFLTANHCIDDETTAATLNTYWFFEAAACGSTAVLNSQQLTGGATLLATDGALDNTLLRLNDSVPAGATLSGFDANLITQTQTAIGIHHPKGDLKKFNEGAILGYGAFNGQGSYIEVRWNTGATEGGSSGSGVFTQQGGLYYVRGALKGGASYCEYPSGTDLYSRLDLAWPGLKPFLGTEIGSTVVVEYYHSGMNHYFMSGFPEEVAALDAGKIPGWSRTGQTFIAYSQPSNGAAEVCRFFNASFAPKSSHFYTPNPSECAALKNGSNWGFEAIAFYVDPVSLAGVCPASTRPLYRLYNNGMSGAPNHRYTTSLSLRNKMITQGWLPEGFGPNAVIACVR